MFGFSVTWTFWQLILAIGNGGNLRRLCCRLLVVVTDLANPRCKVRFTLLGNDSLLIDLFVKYLVETMHLVDNVLPQLELGVLN